MDLRNLCQTDVATIALNDSVQEATWKMREEHVGALVAVEQREGGQIPRGILTDRDIVVDLVAEGATDLENERVADAMNDELVTAHIDATPDDVIRQMEDKGVRRIPVVKDDDTLFGIVALDDMLSYVTNLTASLASVVGSEIFIEKTKDAP